MKLLVEVLITRTKKHFWLGIETSDLYALTKHGFKDRGDQELVLLGALNTAPEPYYVPHFNRRLRVRLKGF